MYRLTLKHLSADQAQLIATALDDQANELTEAIGLWEETDECWMIEIYLKAGQGPAHAIKTIERIADDLGITALECEQEVLGNRDWVVEGLKDLKPIHAGRFFVHGHHDRDKRRAGGINLELDAGQAFGTGHHGTTLGCLTALDTILKRQSPKNMLDLGCGTGILAIAAARATSKPVMASDIDPIAVEVTRANAKANKVAPLVTALTATGTAHAALQAKAPYDLIMANILARPLMELAPHITPLLAGKGTLVLSGLLMHQAARIIARYRAQGLILLYRDDFEGWATLTLVRNTCS